MPARKCSKGRLDVLVSREGISNSMVRTDRMSNVRISSPTWTVTVPFSIFRMDPSNAMPSLRVSLSARTHGGLTQAQTSSAQTLQCKTKRLFIRTPFVGHGLGECLGRLTKRSDSSVSTKYEVPRRRLTSGVNAPRRIKQLRVRPHATRRLT